MTKYSTIALDMDGTMLNENNEVSERLVQVVHDLHAQGTSVLIASGRTKKEIIESIPDDLPIRGFVAANGMEVFTKDKTIIQHTLPAQLLSEIIADARSKHVYYEIHPIRGQRHAHRDDRAFFEREMHKQVESSILEHEIFARSHAIKHQIKWTDQLSFTDAIKVYFFAMKQAEIIAWKNHLASMAGASSQIELFSSSLHNVEIMAANVSKQSGLAILMEQFGLSNRELLVVGDGENDLPMFAYAAHAVAMKNASLDVQNKADEVTDFSYDEDGLAIYLEQLCR